MWIGYSINYEQEMVSKGMTGGISVTRELRKKAMILNSNAFY